MTVAFPRLVLYLPVSCLRVVKPLETGPAAVTAATRGVSSRLPVTADAHHPTVGEALSERVHTNSDIPV